MLVCILDKIDNNNNDRVHNEFNSNDVASLDYKKIVVINIYLVYFNAHIYSAKVIFSWYMEMRWRNFRKL